jgi:hypothetical protein
MLIEQGETLRIEDNKRGFGEFFVMLFPFNIKKVTLAKSMTNPDVPNYKKNENINSLYRK